MAPDAYQLSNQVPWRRSFSPVRRTANSDILGCCLTLSHHGEAGAAPLRQPTHFFCDI
jgi:hypothetical protein